ncbi:hypothetical protein [Thalassobius sp. Cn5-15]|uniref:hypothetical protein n=1 Tax=Thalassobius sp. Cn5-15 TaxID=2917763 RepID=UPI001EF32200|nr:hypothetical protein [Thalassobius sp. Cn5-15]MCG7493574.1 hypothetical protein [Thalassobius sp. Cn5-15]
MTTETAVPEAIVPDAGVTASITAAATTEATATATFVEELAARDLAAQELAAQELAACVDAAFPLPSLLFVLGALTVLFYLKRKHRLSLGGVFKAMVGVDRVPHNKVSSTLMIVALLVPLGVWIVLGARCG